MDVCACLAARKVIKVGGKFDSTDCPTCSIVDDKYRGVHPPTAMTQPFLFPSAFLLSPFNGVQGYNP